ncbi:hypothetical protein CB1_001533043 [Camelus ferus]|nr:hypothetical protein CB1_001533043 [Camelus ferus]
MESHIAAPQSRISSLPLLVRLLGSAMVLGLWVPRSVLRLTGRQVLRGPRPSAQRTQGTVSVCSAARVRLARACSTVLTKGLMLYHCQESSLKAFSVGVIRQDPRNQLKKIRSLLLAGAADYDNFFQHLRLLDGAFKLSAKDLRSQVVREACITLGHFSREAEHLYHSLESSYQKALQSHLKNSDSIVSLPQSDLSSSSSQESLNSEALREQEEGSSLDLCRR